MKIVSFARYGYQLKPIEVEVSFVPGIPKINFLGQPDSIIKESELRIKSALKHQGFDFPRGQQVVVNLKPSYLKKTSQGVDLAVAVAILRHTGQIDLSDLSDHVTHIYGALDLHGQVEVPDDLDSLLLPWGEPILTGVPLQPYPFDLLTVECLKDLDNIKKTPARSDAVEKVLPTLDSTLRLGEQQAELMKLISLGEHSIVLAGPSGSGKTTFAKHLHSVLMPPNEADFRLSRQINKILGHRIDWRPLIHPHPTITPIAMIGGGAPIFPGELTRAHSGMLLLDELLEFKSEVKEALREPIESGDITVARRGKAEKLPAKFLLIATTNLCPCGDMVPGKMSSCRFSIRKCRSYSEKLSGPILDRFQALSYTQNWLNEPKKIPLKAVLESVEDARGFAKEMRGQVKPNGCLTEAEFNEMNLKNINDLKPFMPELQCSYRRKLSLFKVARSFADLHHSAEIKPQHIEMAAQISLYSFEKLKRIFS